MARVQTQGHFNHQVSGRVEYLTPKIFIDRLGPFDLDPCASVVRPWSTAKVHLTSCGLEAPWKGFIFLNPPYGRTSNEHLWLAKLAAHGNGIALVFVKTETRSWQENVWGKANGILMLGKRISFCNTDGSTTEGKFGASCLIAYGSKALTKLRRCGFEGYLITDTEYIYGRKQ